VRPGRVPHSCVPPAAAPPHRGRQRAERRTADGPHAGRGVRGRRRVRLAQAPQIGSGPARYSIQVGSFTPEASAQALKAELEPKVAGVHIVKALVGGETYYRVRIGNFPSRADARKAAERLSGLGYRVVIMESVDRP
jgi:DedD protein